MAEKIRTPRGKLISPAQYQALVRMREMSDAGASPCQHGHYDCAAWSHGPCSAELEANTPTGEER